MEILRYLTSPRSSSKGNQPRNDFDAIEPDQDDNQVEVFGSESVEIDEPVGIFLPRLRRRPQLLQLDQVQHMLHYDNYRKVMRVQDISIVRSVEELDDKGQLQWWMSIQDAATIQVWIVHFSSLHRLTAWVSLLRSFTSSTRTRSLIADVVHANGSCPHSIKSRSSSVTKETILTMHPKNSNSHTTQ